MNYYFFFMNLFFLLSLHIFVISKSVIWNFVCFCIWFLLTMGMIIYNVHCYWDSLMITIIMLTALFLVFFYIVSVNPEMPLTLTKKYSVIWTMILFFIFLPPLSTLCQLNEIFLGSTYCDKNMEITSNNILPWGYPLKILLLSLFILILLLFLVMIFVRMTHFKKNGGMRSKF